MPAQPLPPRTQYRVEVQGVLNINQLPNGGGSVTFTTRPPARADSTVAPVRRDTVQARQRRP